MPKTSVADTNDSFADDKQPVVKPESAAFVQLNPDTSDQAESQNLDFFMDIPMEIIAQLGTSTITVNNMLNMAAGSIIELDKVAGGTAELFVNGKLFAMGEVVVVDNHLGVRITEFIAQTDRNLASY